MIAKAGRPRVTQHEDNYCTLNQKSLTDLPEKNDQDASWSIGAGSYKI